MPVFILFVLITLSANAESEHFSYRPVRQLQPAIVTVEARLEDLLRLPGARSLACWHTNSVVQFLLPDTNNDSTKQHHAGSDPEGLRIGEWYGVRPRAERCR